MLYYGQKISPHLSHTPEGYLICQAVPIGRTGDMQYMARELNINDGGDPERLIAVSRDAAELFALESIASFEGKPVTDEHPQEDVAPDNWGNYARGHAQNVRKDGDFLVADLLITDPTLINEVENGAKREVSCGYNCDVEESGGKYRQTNIRGNHIAIVPNGRAGHDVAIKDAASAAKTERRKKSMSKNASIFKMFGRAVKDAEPDEIETMAADAANMLESAPAEKAPEDEPKKLEDAPTAPPAGNDVGAKLDKLIAMMGELLKGTAPEKLEDSPEEDIDNTIGKLTGHKEPDGDEGDNPQNPSDDDGDEVIEDCDTTMRDAAVMILRAARPSIAAMKDPAEKRRMADALLKSIRTDTGKKLLDATKSHVQDSAPETRVKEQQEAYNSRNPHNHKNN